MFGYTMKIIYTNLEILFFLFLLSMTKNFQNHLFFELYFLWDFTNYKNT